MSLGELQRYFPEMTISAGDPTFWLREVGKHLICGKCLCCLMGSRFQ